MNLDRRLLSLARNPWLALCLTIFCGVAAGWLTIGQARGFSLVVDGVFLGGKKLDDVRDLLLLMGVLIGGRSLLAWIMETSAGAVAVRVKTDLRHQLLSRITNLGPAYTRSERTGELAATVTDGVEALDAYFSQYLPQLIISSLVPLSILIFVFPLDPLSGVVLLFTAPLIPLFMILIGKGAEKVTHRQYETLGRLSAHFLESLQGLTTLKQLGRSRDHIHLIKENSEKFRDVTLSVLRVTFLSALALELIATVSTAIIAVEVGLRLLHGALPFDKALFLLVLAPEFYIPLRMLGLRFHAGMAGTAAARRIYAILEEHEDSYKAEEQNQARGAMKLNPGDLLEPIQKLEFKNVTYCYPGESEPAVKQISLEINHGEHIALVGTSGAGKSTLASLLLGFIHPQAGEILINDVDGKNIPLEIWRRNIAWVPQDPYLFHDSIAANLRIAREDAGEAEMEVAARAACLDKFVHSLPKGYDTIIGEEGVRLSGGQAQRLALARAFLKDAPILILDEPTSSIDPKTETLLQIAIRRLLPGRMVITIAHRLNTVTQADRILVLQEGSVLEAGTHSELVAKQGGYARMIAAMQADGNFIPDQVIDKAPNTQEPGTESIQSLSPRENVPMADNRHPMGRLLSFIRGSWGRVGLSVILGAVTIGASIGLMGTASWLIATAALQPSIAELSLAIVGVRFFGISRGIFRYLERLISHTVTFNLLAQLRTWFYEKLEPLAPRRLSEYRSADLLERIVANVDILENFYGRVISPTLVALIISVGTAIFLGGLNPVLGWTSLGFSITLGLLLPFLTKLLGENPGREFIRLGASLKIKTVDIIQGMADLLAFGRSEAYLASIQKESLSFGKAQKRISLVFGFGNGGYVLISQMGMWAVLVLSISQVTTGQLEGVLLPVLPLMFLASCEASQPLFKAFQNFSTCKTAARRLYEIVDQDDAKKTRVTTASPPIAPAESSAININGLTFTYPGSATPALQDFSMELPEGKRIALVGPSGAGKSTLVNILLRFWEAPRGSIVIAGRDLMDFREEDARSNFNVISQRSFFFFGTIRQNLYLAKPDASQAELDQAARLAGLFDFIQQLPRGMDTLIGERGIRLSGGERQRLAIARSLLKNAPVYILDEPTTHLDNITGKAIMENILQLTEGHSLLLITHRLSELEKMDEIIFLDEGVIKERGSHSTLLKMGGLYKQMADIQARILVSDG